MNKLKLIIFAAAWIAGDCAFAQDITVDEPGSLSSLIDNLNTNSLSISGSINAQDLFFISENLSSLTSLNLSNATITSYNGESLNGAEEYAAGLIPTGTFAGSKISSLQLPASLQSIGMAAFACCNSLTDITIPDCEIGEYAFSDCKNITTITVSSNADITNGAFARCTSLTTINGDKDIANIGNEAFMGCTSLKSFTFGNKLQSIGDAAFSHTSLVSVDMTEAEALKSIGNQAFANNASLKSVNFNSTNTVTLGEGAFFGCTGIKSINLPQGDMPDYLLTDTKSIENLTISDSVDYIGTNAMTGMTALSSINATELTKVPELGKDVWHGVNQPNVTVYTDQSDIIDSFKAAEQWSEFNFTVYSSANDIIKPGETSVTGRFEGKVLRVMAHGCEIASVTLFDAAGTTLTTVDVQGDSATINTANFSTPIYIVNATLSNGNFATIKLIRK